MESTTHRLHYWEFKVWQPKEPHTTWLRPRSQSPSPIPKRVLLNYFLVTRPCNIIRPLDRTAPRPFSLGNQQIPFPGTHEIVDRDTLFSSAEETRQIIAANLSELLRYAPRMRIDHERIVNEVVSVSRIACSDVKNAGRETIPVIVEIRALHVSISEERELIQRFADSIANTDTGYGMVRASKRSILGLETKKIEGSDTATNCVVCLEQFCSGTEVTSMPCSHMFHQECITNWLETSHHCPICRFKMPTEKDENEDPINYRD